MHCRLCQARHTSASDMGIGDVCMGVKSRRSCSGGAPSGTIAAAGGTHLPSPKATSAATVGMTTCADRIKGAHVDWWVRCAGGHTAAMPTVHPAGGMRPTGAYCKQPGNQPPTHLVVRVLEHKAAGRVHCTGHERAGEGREPLTTAPCRPRLQAQWRIPQPCRCPGRGVLTMHGASVGAEQARQHPQQGALPAAVCAKEHVEPAVRHLQARAVQHPLAEAAPRERQVHAAHADGAAAGAAGGGGGGRRHPGGGGGGGAAAAGDPARPWLMPVRCCCCWCGPGRLLWVGGGGCPARHGPRCSGCCQY